MRALSNQRILMISLIVLLLTAACVIPSSLSGIMNQPPAQTTPGTGETAPDGPETQVAGQLITSTAAPKPTSTATLYPTLRPSSTPWPTLTSVGAIPRPPACDQSGFVGDVTIPDGTDLPGGTTLVKTWKIKNTGTCTWTEDYAIVFYKGDSISYTVKQLPHDVVPGETVEVSVSFTVPSQEGHYRTHFQMRNKRGKPFLGSFYVDFDVVTMKTDTPDPKIRYEFAARQCDAAWTSDARSLSCPGTDGSADGFMLYVINPVLESGYVDNEPGLLMNPPTTSNSFIRAIYPSYTVANGDSFRSIIGCQRGATKCKVRFELSVLSGGTHVLIGAWDESYNEAYTHVDIDLSALAGQSVQFVLTVFSDGISDGDRGLWLRPRIYSQ